MANTVLSLTYPALSVRSLCILHLYCVFPCSVVPLSPWPARLYPWPGIWHHILWTCNVPSTPALYLCTVSLFNMVQLCSWNLQKKNDPSPSLCNVSPQTVSQSGCSEALSFCSWMVRGDALSNTTPHKTDILHVPKVFFFSIVWENVLQFLSWPLPSEIRLLVS